MAGSIVDCAEGPVISFAVSLHGIPHFVLQDDELMRQILLLEDKGR